MTHRNPRRRFYQELHRLTPQMIATLMLHVEQDEQQARVWMLFDTDTLTWQPVCMNRDRCVSGCGLPCPLNNRQEMTRNR